MRGGHAQVMMVWKLEQVGVFLGHRHAGDDQLYAIYHLIAFTGLRRGEACSPGTCTPAGWPERRRDLMGREELDAGYRLLIAEP